MKSTSERVAALRQRRLDAGLVQINVWLQPDQVAGVRALSRQAVAQAAGTASRPVVPQQPAPEPIAAPPVPVRTHLDVRIDFPDKPTSQLRKMLKQIGLNYEGSQDGKKSRWGGKSISIERVNSIRKYIESESGIIRGR